MTHRAAAAHALADTLQSWREMFEPKSRGANIAAGLVVAMVALPLNLALAVACGLPPSAGLMAGVIGGLIGGLIGGSRLNITGPEVALAPLTALIVAAHGIEGMMVATAIAGVVQIGLGVFGVGNLIRMLPRPVIGGFLAAVGLMVLDSQLPHLLGIHDGTRITGAGAHLADGHIDPQALGLGLAVAGLLVVGPRLIPRVPAPLLALGLAIPATALLGLDVVRLTPVDTAALMPQLPDLGGVDVLAVLPSALALAALASVDSLLCAASIDRRMGGAPHRPGQELVAQGLANIVCAMFGAMPVAAAVVRSMAAIEAKGSSRLAGVVQSLVLLAVLVLLSPHLDHVPLAALSGVLVVVGARLIDLGEISSLLRVRRYDLLVFAGTTLGVLFLGFLEGLLIGTLGSMLALVQSSASQLRLTRDRGESVHALRVHGPLVFASQRHFADRFAELARGSSPLLVDVSGVTTWDSSGLSALRAAIGTKAGACTVEVVAGAALPASVLSIELAGVASVRGVERVSPTPSQPPVWELDPAE